MMRQYVVCKSRFPEAPDMLSDQNLFSFKCKSILPDPLRRDPFRFQIRGIMHPVDLFQSLRCGILQSLLLFCTVFFPKEKPSYQSLTSSRCPYSPYSFKASQTSSCVKPKESSYFSEVVVTSSKLFKSEKSDSLLTRVIPVISARS